MHEKDIFWFQVGVYEVEVVQNYYKLAVMHCRARDTLTSNTREELPSKALDLTARKRHKSISFQKIENALSKEVGNDAYVVSKVERIAQVYALVSICLIIESQRRKHSQLDTRCIAIFLYRPNNLHGTSGLFPFVICFDDLSKSSLAQQLYDVVCEIVSLIVLQN